MLWAAAAFSMWGLSVLFWPLVEPTGALEVLMHRIVWAFAFCAVIMTVLRRWRHLKGLSWRSWLLIAAGSVLNAGNWGLFIYSVLSEQVVAASMAYFLNPIASATFGAIVLRERLRVTQLIALVIGVAAVVIPGIAAGANFWLPLVMATCFGLYALVQRVVVLGPIPTLTGESLILTPLAIAVIVVMQFTGTGTTFSFGGAHFLLLVLGGAVTLAPLLAFANAARRTPLTTMAVMQYIAPIIQFLVGVFLMHEPMAPSRWIGIGLVLIAVATFTIGQISSRGDARRNTTPGRVPAPSATEGAASSQVTDHRSAT